MKHLNKILAVLLCVVLLTVFLPVDSHVHAEDAFVVSLGTVQANPGGEVTVDLILENNPGFQVLGVGFSYDTEGLELVRIENKAEGLNMTADQSVIWDGVANYSGNGVLATLTFRVAEDAALGDYTIEVIVMDACNDAFEMLEISVSAGNICVFCNHDDLKPVDAKTADCKNTGNYLYYVCNACGAVLDANKKVTTLADQIIPALGHSWQDATCTAAKICKVCGEEEGKANGHTAGDPVVENTVNATCTQDGGYDTVVYCSVCGVEISRVTTNLPATGHSAGDPVVENTVNATCTQDGGYDTVVYCSVCGVEISRNTTTLAATGHSYAVTGTKDATAAEDGYVIYTCSNCGDSYTETIPATGAGEVLWGDVNGDGNVNYMDAYLIMRYSVGYLTEDALDMTAADVSSDGNVNYMDAYLIMRFAVGSIDKFPVEGN